MTALTAITAYVEHHPVWTLVFMMTFFSGVYWAGIGWRVRK